MGQEGLFVGVVGPGPMFAAAHYLVLIRYEQSSFLAQAKLQITTLQQKACCRSHHSFVAMGSDPVSTFSGLVTKAWTGQFTMVKWQRMVESYDYVHNQVIPFLHSISRAAACQGHATEGYPPPGNQRSPLQKELCRASKWNAAAHSVCWPCQA